MSAPAYMFRPTPGGASSRDTFTTYRMRQALGVIAKPSAADEWAHMPMAQRQRLATDALGMAGLEVYALAWADIHPRDRMRIGAEARRVAQVLL